MTGPQHRIFILCKPSSVVQDLPSTKDRYRVQVFVVRYVHRLDSKGI